MGLPVQDEHTRLPDTQSATRDGLDAMLRLSPDAVVVVASDGRIVRTNPRAAALFRADTGELDGRPVERLVPAAYQDQHVADRAAFAALPRQRSMGAGRDLEAVRLDGSRFPVDISLQPIDLDGTLMTLAVVRDIFAQQALRDANRDLAAHARTLRDFVSLASHELRTSLTAVRGFAGSRRPSSLVVPTMWRTSRPCCSASSPTPIDRKRWSQACWT